MRWAPYVPVAKRREKAAKKMQQLRKKGMTIQPIEIEGRTIACTFWGKAWCMHLEAFCDFDNRLSRGRTYVRNGSVCHLEINEGKVNAMVSGSSLYHVTVSIKPLLSEKWHAIKNTCTGKISSLLDLLSGKLSSGVMNVVCHPNEGLFPLSQELSMQCDCLDWAIMCKHVAAVLYGVGSRLDTDPAQLFKLRGVNFEELIDVNQAITEVTSTKAGRRKRLDDSALTDLFGVSTTDEPDHETPPVPSKKSSISFPTSLTGRAILEKRMALRLTKQAFAKHVGVSTATINVWELKDKAVISPHAASLKKLQAIWS
jgi:uncharacterized Zn finger protein